MRLSVFRDAHRVCIQQLLVHRPFHRDFPVQAITFLPRESHFPANTYVRDTHNRQMVLCLSRLPLKHALEALEMRGNSLSWHGRARNWNNLQSTAFFLVHQDTYIHKHTHDVVFFASVSRQCSLSVVPLIIIMCNSKELKKRYMTKNASYFSFNSHCGVWCAYSTCSQ